MVDVIDTVHSVAERHYKNISVFGAATCSANVYLGEAVHLFGHGQPAAVGTWSEPTEKPFENCTKHFLLPLYSIVWDYNSKQKRQHKYSLEQDTLFWEQEGENMFAALCDDDKYIIEELKKLLLTYAKENRIIIDIDEFESGEKLLNSENNYDIIVLDFQLGSTDGLTVAKELRKRNVLSCIIFLTSYPHFMIDAL